MKYTVFLRVDVVADPDEIDDILYQLETTIGDGLVDVVEDIKTIDWLETAKLPDTLIVHTS